MADLQASRSTATRRAGDELETLLVSESVYTAILLASTALDDVGSHMLRIAWANDKAMALLTKISLPAELRVSEESLLFRQDSPHTTALKEFVILYGGSYLRKILRHSIQTLAKRAAQYEIDPLRVEGGSLEKNIANLRADTEFLLNEILNSFATFPSELSLLFRALYDQVEARFPNAGYRAMGAVFFLRLACPMLVGPTASGVLKADEPVSPALSRGLLLMTKVITSIANESDSFDKEECMRPLSDLVARSIPLVHNFYDLILRAEIFRTQSAGHDANAMEQNATSRTRYKVMEPFLVTVTQFIHRNEERIRGELAKLISQEAADALMEQIFSATLSLQQRLDRKANNGDPPNSGSKRRNSMVPTSVSPLKPIPHSTSSNSLASLVSSSAASEPSVPRSGGSAVMSRDPNAVALSEVLTRLTASSADETAMNAFYYSYRYFVPPIDVINWLLKRHSTPPPVLSTSELLRYKNDVEIPQRVRIAKFVENWLRVVPSELADPEIATILTNYSNTLRNCGMTTNGSNLGSQIATTLAKLKTAEAKNPNSGGVEFGSSPRLPSTAISPPAPSPLGVTLGAASPLLSLSASELAAELASIAYERVRALTPPALCAIMQWAPLSAPENAVVPLIKHVNALHRWVCVSVSHPSTSPKERASLLSHACKLASESRKVGDWLSSTAIAYGIMSGVLVLPHKEAEKVPKSVREMIKINKKDHAKARVPWVAPYLQRLVDSLGPTSPKMVNWDLMVQIGTTISELLSAVPQTSPYVSSSHLRPRILAELAPPAPPSPTRPHAQQPNTHAPAASAAHTGAMLPHSVSAGALSSTAAKPPSGVERVASTSQLSLSDAQPTRRASLQPTMPAAPLIPLPLLRYAVTRVPRVASLPVAASPTVVSAPMQPRSLSTPTPPSVVAWSDMIRPDDTHSGRRSPAPSMTSEDSNWDCTSDSSISGDARLAADADFFDH